MSEQLTLAQLQQQYPLLLHYNEWPAAENVHNADDVDMEEEDLSSSNEAMEWTPVSSVRSVNPGDTPQWSPVSNETDAAASIADSASSVCSTQPYITAMNNSPVSSRASPQASPA